MTNNENNNSIISNENSSKYFTSESNKQNNNNNNNSRLSTSSITTNSSIISKLISSSTSNASNDDDNNDKRLSSMEQKDGKKRNRTRFDIALLGMAIAAVNCYAQATFCIAIVEMVLPADFLANNNTNDTVIKLGLASTSKSVTLGDLSDNLVKSIISNNTMDQSCPIEYKYKDYYDHWRFPDTTSNDQYHTTSSSSNQSSITKSNNIDISNRFNWDASQQGLLLGAFAIGTAPLQVVAGRLAEIYGAKWVLLIGCIGTGLTNITIPFLARFSFILLLLNRVLMGIAQAGMEPGLMCLLAKWLTPEEAGLYISMSLFAMCIGFFLGSLFSSFILSIGYGWPLAYYVSGSFNLIIAIIWLIYANSKPEESKIISKEELFYIKCQQEKVLNNNNNKSNDLNYNNSINCDRNNDDLNIEYKENKGEEKGAPWLKILSTRSVWAFIICKFSIRWCADVVSIELPTYLANVLHLSIRLNGILNSISSALFAIFSFLAGYVANEILINQQKKLLENNNSKVGKYKYILSKTNLRKIIQSIASFGSAISIFLMTKYDCNILLSMSMLLVLSCCLVMGTGGELQIPYDMSPRYPGTLHGMACTMSVSGWFAPPMIGLILGDQPNSRYRWSIVWYLTAFINLFGGLVFVLFADASPRDFDKKSHPPKIDETGRETTTNYHGKKGRQNQNDLCNLNTSKKIDEENWCPFFDRELIKIRQVEDSYIKRPSYLNDFDSIITHNESVIYPYKEFNLNNNVVHPSKEELTKGSSFISSSSSSSIEPFAFLSNKQTKFNKQSGKRKINFDLLESKQQEYSTSSSSLSSIPNINSNCCLEQRSPTIDCHNQQQQQQMNKKSLIYHIKDLPRIFKTKQQETLRDNKNSNYYASNSNSTKNNKTITHL